MRRWRRWTRRCWRRLPTSAPSPLAAFWLVTFPLSLPGVGAGALLCFIPIVGEFVIPDLLAGSSSMMIGQTLWLEFFTNKDWPVASAAAVALLLLLVPPLLLYDRLQRRTLAGGGLMARRVNSISRFNVTSLALGLAFLYLPIVILVIYSFNASRLVTVWGGWSLRWYAEFFNDRAMLDAAWMSLRVAAVSATVATLLGTLGAVALARGERFRGRALFSGHAVFAAGDARGDLGAVAAVAVRGARTPSAGSGPSRLPTPR